MHGDARLTVASDGRREGFWRDRPVFVTGATGLLGGWLVARLLELEACLTCLVRDWVPQSELVRSRLIEQTSVVRGDVRDQELLERAIGESESQVVFHLAAQTIVGIANRNPISTLDTNIRGTWSLLEACRRSPTVKQVIVASSDKAYGDGDGQPYEESTPLRPKHPYDASKACADMVARSYRVTFGVPVCVTRCGNLYGGGDLNWNRIVPGTIRSVLRKERPIIRSDGNCVRDYFHVTDAVEAYLLLVESMDARPELCGEVFNFSNETPVTVLELAGRILRLMGSQFELEVQATAAHEIRWQVLSAEKARTMLQWRPRLDLDEGLAQTIGWYERFFAAMAARGLEACPEDVEGRHRLSFGPVSR
jgi:CDP-glucose 4,6-dehydratase